MKLPTPFYKLPLRFDVERMRAEVAQFGEQDWLPHPQNFAGNSALILVSAGGTDNDDMAGSMLPTPKLERCPYLQQVMASFDTVIGRSRLMRLAGGEDVQEHIDIHPYWHHRIRIHVPIVTDPSIEFWCDGHQIHMAAGEAWVFDNWRMHKVLNPSTVTRIHLVADTTGSAAFWELVRRAHAPFGPDGGDAPADAALLPYAPDQPVVLRTERHPPSAVLAPGELDGMLRDLLEDVSAAGGPADALQGFVRVVNDLLADWRCTWSVHGEQPEALAEYRRLLDACLERAQPLAGLLRLHSNGYGALEILKARLGAALGTPAQAPRARSAPGAARSGSRRAVRGAREPVSLFDRPAFIVSAPRAGSSLLYETLAANRGLWTIGGESHFEIESIPSLNPVRNGRGSNRLLGEDATAEVRTRLLRTFAGKLRNSDGALLRGLAAAQRPERVRFLEKTPKNALRIPFLRALFADARFVVLHRDPRANLSSIIEAWRSGRFVTYPRLPGWEGAAWSLLLPPGWEALNGSSLAEIAAFQWRCANEYILDDLADLPADRWHVLSYEALLAEPATVLRRVCEFLDLPFGPKMRRLAQGTLPLSRHTLTAPAPDKWRQNEALVNVVLPLIEPVAQRLRGLTARAA